MDKPRIIFWGTPEFAIKPLETLIKNFDVVAVVTNPDEPFGRKKILTPPPVKAWVRNQELTLQSRFQRDSGQGIRDGRKIQNLQPEKLDQNFASQISELKPDLFVVAAYGKIIPNYILEIPKCGSLNIHPSLLPRWRGPSPIQYAILNGDEETGVTIMLMDEKMDHGPLVANYKLQITNYKTTTLELSKKLSEMGAELIIKVIPKWINSKIKAILQDESKAIYSKILKREDGKIDWSKPAEIIERQIRAFLPWPGSYTFWEIGGKKKQLNVQEANTVLSSGGEDGHRPPGFVKITNGKLLVKTGSGLLEILKIQPEGGKPMRASEFINGYSGINGSILK